MSKKKMNSNRVGENYVIDFLPFSVDQTANSGDIRYRKNKTSHKAKAASSMYDTRDDYFKKKPSQAVFGVPLRDIQIIAGLTLLAVIVRLHQISEPSSVVFDEVHFGGFASKYMKGRFFMDVHPPLAKLLITLAGLIGGFDGNFDFKEIGKDYIEPKVPYVAMRLLPGILGVLVVPIAYLTIKLSGFSTISALLVGALLTLENGLITQSRLILLDSPLILFTAFTVLMWVNFHNQQQSPFTFWWWFWMAMTGIGLGLTVSVKWVGLFTIALIGFSTVKGLWDLLGDLRISPGKWVQHFIARALCLILIPIILYMFMFQIHFLILQNSGDGDGFMSAEFQQSINGRKIEDTFIDVAYGSKVTIKHLNTQGGYLHSHGSNYPEGSKQQQITLYSHKDDNNIWIIQNQTKPEIPFEEQDPIWISNGHVIKLEHMQTAKKLHSHDIRPPVTDIEYQNEVSGYGFPNFEGDDNDLWRVEIHDHDESDPESGQRLRTLHTKFRLAHVLSGCYLFSHSVKLPDWGFEQQEVTCVKGGHVPKTLWYIETNSHPKLPPDAEVINYRKLGFFGRFFELNRVMWKTNAGLTDSHPYDSRPFSWLLMNRGISFWGKDHRHIYLLGNPVIWWSSTATLCLYVVIKVVTILRTQRGYLDHLNVTKGFYESHANFLFLGWILHWAPFFLMSRQLFLHHYFPALYFAVLLFGVAFDLFTIPLNVRNRAIVALLFLLASLYVFTLFAPITYGKPWIKSECHKLKWVTTWDFDCNQFHDTYDQFNTNLSQIHITPTTESISSTSLSPQMIEQNHVVETNNAESSGKDDANMALNNPSEEKHAESEAQFHTEHQSINTQIQQNEVEESSVGVDGGEGQVETHSVPEKGNLKEAVTLSESQLPKN
ncbi:hypothetical protein G9A89_007038 [Geosiphon pyriformis]|nr:hypothetical protein G9A89_007038 [Geosiphon pyriformis]